MLRKICYSLLFLIPFIFLTNVLDVDAGGRTTVTKNSDGSNQTQTFNEVIDDAVHIYDVRLIRGGTDRVVGVNPMCRETPEGTNNLGSLTYTFTKNTSNLTVNLSGSSWDRATCDRTYETKYISDYPSTSNYKDSGGYSGTLERYVKSGEPSKSKSATDSRVRNSTSGFPNSVSYSDSSNYSGTLTRDGSPREHEVISGSPPDTKYISDWGSSYYSDSSGYSGTLTYYAGSPAGSLIADDVRVHLDIIDCDVHPTTIYKTEGSYSGYISKEYCTYPERFVGMIGSIPIYVNDTYAYYKGTIYKSDTRRYRGNVSRPDTRVYNYIQYYSGTVRTPDTRVWSHRGTVYRGEWINRQYNYTFVVDYHYNRPPVVNSISTDKDRYSEVNGYNVINLTGRASDPDGDRLTIYYEIAGASGTTSINSGSNFTFNIPIDGKIPEGTHTLSVWADDNDTYGRMTSPVVTKTITVDKTIPLGNLREVNGPQSYQINLEFTNVNGAIAGLHSDPYNIERSENNGNFINIYGWNSSNRYNDTNVKSNHKYSYRGYVRDVVGHITETNWVEFITSPRVSKIALDPEDSSTVVMELEQTLPNGIVVEVKRSGSLVAIIQSGKDFIDPNLDYERLYTYELTAVGTDRFGNRLESVPITVSQWTGVPDIELTLNHPYDTISNQYLLQRTIFSDNVEIKGDVFYRHGGEVELSYVDKKGNNSKELILNPYETKPFEITSYYNNGDTSTINANLLDKGFDISDSENIRVDIKEVVIERLSERKRDLIYN